MATEAGWFYRDFARGSPIEGPFTIDELAERAQTGELAHNSLVRFEAGEWHQADQIAVLITALRERRDSGRGAVDVEMIRQEVQASRRRLNWVTLFVVATFLGVISAMLISVDNWRYAPLAPPGLVISSVASVIFLCAIIRWAINPLFAQMVDTNDNLARIASLLRENRERNESPAGREIVAQGVSPGTNL